MWLGWGNDLEIIWGLSPRAVKTSRLSFFFGKNMGCFMNLCAILVQRPCSSSLYYSSCSACAAEVSTLVCILIMKIIPFAHPLENKQTICWESVVNKGLQGEYVGAFWWKVLDWPQLIGAMSYDCIVFIFKDDETKAQRTSVTCQTHS